MAHILQQGPALYAYNDAQFTTDDWTGIRMLCNSLKTKDPMKVGRFGLGFKSVFHVTGKGATVRFAPLREELTFTHYNLHDLLHCWCSGSPNYH